MSSAPSSVLAPDLLRLCDETAENAERLIRRAIVAVRAKVSAGDALSSELMEREQHACHGLAWLATYVEGIKQMASYARRLSEAHRFGEIEALLTQIGIGEYAAQIVGGIPMSQSEIIRSDDLGLEARDREMFATEAVAALIRANNPQARKRLVELVQHAAGTGHFGDGGLDETLEAMRGEMIRFVEAEVKPYAHEWHLKNEYIPLETIAKMNELGVFGLTIPEEFGGLGLGKEAMCVVSEELSRGYIGVGSLGTRSEIAAELILGGGTPEQKEEWLPKIASGEVLPTAVFTEPNTGSDLASLKTRAVRVGDVYKITGQKTWITHPVRADLMTVLARTNPAEPGYRGLSMFLAEKPRGTNANPFPAKGMTGGEIEVLGYRGMKEYELSFDGFEVPADGASRRRGRAGLQAAHADVRSRRASRRPRGPSASPSRRWTSGLRYAMERQQFGKPIISFPRVSDKIAMMAAETMIARQLTYFAGREKDGGHRCDLEAGMAKLLAARVAWSSADNALQIHGGNGFALEYPISRVLCDARILSIFEGAAEIQAQVIARRLLEVRN